MFECGAFAKIGDRSQAVALPGCVGIGEEAVLSPRPEPFHNAESRALESFHDPGPCLSSHDRLELETDPRLFHAALRERSNVSLDRLKSSLGRTAPIISVTLHAPRS